MGLVAYAGGAVIGITLGVIAALNRNTFIDRMTMAVAVFGYSMPNFFSDFS